MLRLAGGWLARSGLGSAEDADLDTKAGLDAVTGLVGMNSGGLNAPQMAQAALAPGHWSLYHTRRYSLTRNLRASDFFEKPATKYSSRQYSQIFTSFPMDSSQANDALHM